MKRMKGHKSKDLGPSFMETRTVAELFWSAT
jgi:hypothetical protein